MKKNDEINDLLNEYISTYDEIKITLQNINEEVLDFKSEPDKWSIREILNHLCDSEIMAVTRMYRIISQDNPTLEAYNQNVWAEKFFYTQLDSEASLLIFGLIRHRTNQLLKLLPDSAWDRVGTHTEKGKVTLHDMLKNYVEHGENHLQQIKKNLSSIKTK